MQRILTNREFVNLLFGHLYFFDDFSGVLWRGMTLIHVCCWWICIFPFTVWGHEKVLFRQSKVYLWLLSFTLQFIEYVSELPFYPESKINRHSIALCWIQVLCLCSLSCHTVLYSKMTNTYNSLFLIPVVETKEENTIETKNKIYYLCYFVIEIRVIANTVLSVQILCQ